MDWYSRARDKFPEIGEENLKNLDNPMGLWLELFDMLDEAIASNNESLVGRIFNESLYYLEKKDRSTNPEFDCFTVVAFGFFRYIILIKDIENHILNYIDKETFVGLREILTNLSKAHRKKYNRILELYN